MPLILVVIESLCSWQKIQIHRNSQFLINVYPSFLLNLIIIIIIITDDELKNTFIIILFIILF